MNYKYDLILMYTYLYTAFKIFDNAHIRNTDINSVKLSDCRKISFKDDCMIVCDTDNLHGVEVRVDPENEEVTTIRKNTQGEIIENRFILDMNNQLVRKKVDGCTWENNVYGSSGKCEKSYSKLLENGEYEFTVLNEDESIAINYIKPNQKKKKIINSEPQLFLN